jgi:hypothetical protein
VYCDVGYVLHSISRAMNLPHRPIVSASFGERASRKGECRNETYLQEVLLSSNNWVELDWWKYRSKRTQHTHVSQAAATFQAASTFQAARVLDEGSFHFLNLPIDLRLLGQHFTDLSPCLS